MKPNELQHYDVTDARIVEATGHFDTNESIFFARQLEFIKGKAYDVKRPVLSALSLMPVATDVSEGAETITYRQYDTVGMAKIIANYADDLPRADVTGKEFTSPIRGIGVSYGYSVQEIRAAIYANTNLDMRKMRAAQRAHEEIINTYAWAGDTVSNLPGFLSNANIPAYTIPADGTGSSKLFSTKTPDQILRDMNGIVNAIITTTKGVHRPNQLWMNLANYTYIASTVRGSTSDASILDVFKRNNPGVEVKGVVELAAAVSGNNTMVALENNADNFSVQIPMLFRQHPPQQRNLEFMIPCESRFGGVTIPYPLAFAIADSI